jgi:hypothetical protein
MESSGFLPKNIMRNSYRHLNCEKHFHGNSQFQVEYSIQCKQSKFSRKSSGSLPGFLEKSTSPIIGKKPFPWRNFQTEKQKSGSNGNPTWQKIGGKRSRIERAFFNDFEHIYQNQSGCR